MILDALLSFVPIGAPLSLVGATGQDFASNVIDILGLGVGVAPSERIIGTPTIFGENSGYGAVKPQVQCNVGTALVSANNALLNIKFQAAVDQGAAGGYQPGTWTTLVETGPIALTNLSANARAGLFDWPPAVPDGYLPRYLRLLFSSGGAGFSFSAGTIASALVTMVRDDVGQKYAAKNFTMKATA